MNWCGVAFLGLAVAVAGCDDEDMYRQERAFSWGAFGFLRHQMTMQHPAPGTIARDESNAFAPQPAMISTALLARGHERFDIDCAPCHGRSGDGLGMIVERGFPRPPSLFNDKLLHASARHFYDVMKNGYGVMFSYADRVAPADRWAITAYIRALQLSEHAQVASLSEQDKSRLQETGP